LKGTRDGSGSQNRTAYAEPNQPAAPQKNLEGFAKQKGIVVKERVDHMAANRQITRAKELRDFL
jgi:hypothetical protein